MERTLVSEEPETTAVEPRAVLKRRGLIAGAAALAAGILAAKAQPAAASNGQALVGGQGNGAGLMTELNWDAAGGPLNYPVQFLVTDNNALDTGYPANIQGYASGTAHTATPTPITTGVYGITSQGGGYGTVGVNTANSATAIGVRGHSSIGFGAFFTGLGQQGVQAKGPTGIGGYGTSGTVPVGVYGSGDSGGTGTVGIGVNAYGANGVSGQANSANGIGVVGTSLGAGGGGVTGISAGAGATGIKGQSVGANGIGAEGIAGGTNSYGVEGMIPQGTTSAGTIGVYGINYSSAPNSHGIVGLAKVAGHGLIGTSDSVSPQTISGTTYYYAGLVGLGNNGSNAGNFYGNVSITGTLNGHAAVMTQMSLAIAHDDGTHRLAHGITAAEAWFEDFGKGTISNGQAEVKIDAEFAAIADLNDYHVFLTSNGDANLHVAATQPGSFTVRVTGANAGAGVGAVSGAVKGAGASNTTFSWRVVARPKGVPSNRLAKYTAPNIVPPVIPAPHDTSKQVILKTAPQPALPDNAPTPNTITP